MDYKGYSLRYDNHKLYVKIKGSVFALGKREGAFRFTVDTKQYGSIQEIYLQDDLSQRKIWPRQNRLSPSLCGEVSFFP